MECELPELFVESADRPDMRSEAEVVSSSLGISRERVDVNM